MKIAVFQTSLSTLTAWARLPEPGARQVAEGAEAGGSLRQIPFLQRAARQLRQLACAAAGD